VAGLSAHTQPGPPALAAAAGEGSAEVGNGPLADPPPYAKRAMPGSRKDDRRLLREARDGSVADLEALFRAHWHRAHRAAYLVVHDVAAAEDIAQEAFISAVRALDRFDRRRPFGPWLHRIVVNRAIDWARARAVRREVSGAIESEQAPGRAPADEPGPSSSPYSEEIVAALGVLSPEHRAVIVMRYLLEYTPGEIAAALELPRGTVNSRLRRGLDHLARQLGDELE
jgi:RNA polymerase sigma-70 factor (ECF subfamily)